MPHEFASNAFGVADPLDDAARYGLYIDIGFRAHFAGHDDQTRRAKRFAGHFRLVVVAQEFV